MLLLLLLMLYMNMRVCDSFLCMHNQHNTCTTNKPRMRFPVVVLFLWVLLTWLTMYYHVAHMWNETLLHYFTCMVHLCERTYIMCTYTIHTPHGHEKKFIFLSFVSWYYAAHARCSFWKRKKKSMILNSPLAESKVLLSCVQAAASRPRHNEN